MDFDWDAANIEHIARHVVTPAEAEQVIDNSPFEIGKLERNGEFRMVHLGETDVGRVLIVAITLRAQRIRVVTAYPANRKFRNFYTEQKEQTMTQTLETPEFKNDKEEAGWYDTHQDDLLAQFEQAASDGTLGQGTLARRAQTAATSIRLDTADIELAKSIAEKLGLRYQTYLKMIIHQHLLQEADASAMPK